MKYVIYEDSHGHEIYKWWISEKIPHHMMFPKYEPKIKYLSSGKFMITPDNKAHIVENNSNRDKEFDETEIGQHVSHLGKQK